MGGGSAGGGPHGAGGKEGAARRGPVGGGARSLQPSEAGHLPGAEWAAELSGDDRPLKVLTSAPAIARAASAAAIHSAPGVEAGQSSQADGRGAGPTFGHRPRRAAPLPGVGRRAVRLRSCI